MLSDDRRRLADAFHSQVDFETPENVVVSYPIAGGGTRFLAWLVDELVVWVGTALVAVALLILSIAFSLFEQQLNMFDPASGPQAGLYAVGAILVLVTFGAVLYFFVSELLLEGTTLGKRLFGLRVVKANGFSLDAMSLLIRNLFRLVDHLPPLWIIPMVSRSTQRSGDLVAGTLVVQDRTDRMRRIRSELAGRDPLAARFQFDRSSLEHLRPVDVEFVERLLQRWDRVPRRQLLRILRRSLPPLARRLRTGLPARADVVTWFEDLLAAAYRRRSRAF